MPVTATKSAQPAANNTPAASTRDTTATSAKPQPSAIRKPNAVTKSSLPTVKEHPVESLLGSPSKNKKRSKSGNKSSTSAQKKNSRSILNDILMSSSSSSRPKLSPQEYQAELLKKKALELCMSFVNLLKNQKYAEALEVAREILVIEPNNQQILQHLPMLEEIVSDNESDDDDDSDEEEGDKEDGIEKAAASENPQGGEDGKLIVD